MNNKTESAHHISGIILSGGAGSRFGGLDKGLQHYKNKVLIEHVIERLSEQVDNLILCVNRNHEQYQKYGYQLISDQPNNKINQKTIDYQGPMAGIVSTLETFKHSDFNTDQSIVVSSCDSPKLPLNYVSKLRKAMLDHGASSAVVHDGKRSQNLHCLIHSSAWTSLLRFYQSGERAMYKWHKKNGSVEVDFSDQAAYFLNINSVNLLKK